MALPWHSHYAVLDLLFQSDEIRRLLQFWNLTGDKVA